MILRGNLVYLRARGLLETLPRGALVLRGDTVERVLRREEFDASDYPDEPIADYGEKLVIPGMSDLHLHASQYPFCGLVPEEELLEWLRRYAFPEEARYESLDYARAAYTRFADDLLRSPTTRACIFTTVHKDAALLLVELLRERGFAGFVGKVNMDRGGPPALEESTEASLRDTEEFIEAVLSSGGALKPVLTPRFIPSCSDALLAGLGRLREKYALPVQSHLSENRAEVELVKKLCPWTGCYGEAYDRFGLFGGEGNPPAVMAHCVHSGPEEMALMKKNGVFVAHCANSNYSLSSGIAPARRYLDGGLNIGLGTDVAGGYSLSLFRAIQDTVAVSNLRSCCGGGDGRLSFLDAFYLATMGGGAFFGKVGSFLPGYAADVLVLDDAREPRPRGRDLGQRLQRLCFLAERDAVYAKYINGKLVYQAS